MKRVTNETLGGERSINAFVAKKLQRFSEMEHDFAALFSLMFSETDNVLYECSEGFAIKKITYGQARSNALKKAAALKELLKDLPQDTAVGLYMENSPEWIETFWAILCAGFRPLLLNMRLDARSLEEALGETEAGAVISDRMRFSIQTIEPAALSLADAEPADLLFGSEILLMSSGTSANVKICAYTAEEIYHQVRDSYGIIRKCSKVKGFYNGQLKLLAFLPFYHVFGLVAMYIWFAFFSRTFVHLSDLSPHTIQKTILTHEVTHVFAVPLFWDKVYEQALSRIKDRGDKVYAKFARALKLAQKLSVIPVLGECFSRVAFREVRENLFGESIRFMITGGSSIRPEVLAFFNGIGYRLANGYGMSEIGISSVELSSDPKYLYAGYVGEPLSSLEYSINEAGELLVRGKTISRYVLECGFKSTCPDWFNTHDLAECVGGHYRILGRKDDLVVGPDGENLNPNLIEDRLRIPGIRELCLIDASGPTLLCSLPEGITQETFDTLSGKLKEQIALSGLAGFRLAFTTDPLMGEGEFKCNRRRIRETFLRKGFRPVDTETFQKAASRDRDPLYEEVRTLFAKALGRQPEEILPSMNFFLDLGGTSLDYFALLSALRERFGMEFPVTAGMNLGTPEALYDYIRTETGHVD